MNTTDKPKCTAADGKTEVYNLPGVGLVVSAAAFNALVRDAERYRALEWVQEADSLGPIFVARVRRKYPRFMFNVGLTIDAAMQEKQS